jgi:hypothetical protein
MDDNLDDLLESRARLRISAAWLRQPVEGYVEHRLWCADADSFILEADDHVGYRFDRADTSLRVELVSAP